MTSPRSNAGVPAPPDSGLRNILRNSATLIGARIISKFAMTVFMIILARRLGTEDFGIYSSILAFIAFFSMVEEFGMSQPMVRKISRSRKEGGRILGAVVGLRIILGVIAYAMLMITSFWLGLSPQITAVLGLSMIFEILSLTVIRAFEAFEMMKQIAVLTILERIFLCVTGLGVIFMGWSLVGLSYAYLFTFVCSFAYSVFLFQKHVAGFRPYFPAGEWKPILREAMPFVTAGVLSIVWTRTDIYFLTSFRSSAEVGWYTAALRVVEAQIFIPVAILTSVFPVLSRLHDVSHREFNRILWKNFVLLFSVGAAVAIATYFFSGEIIAILFGGKYVQSGPVLRIFSLMILFSFVNYLLGGALIAMGKEIYATTTLGIGAILSAACGFYFIPGNGAPAAGYIKAGTETLSFVFQAVVLAIMIRKTGRTADDAGTGTGRAAEGVTYETLTSRAPDG